MVVNQSTTKLKGISSHTTEAGFARPSLFKRKRLGFDIVTSHPILANREPKELWIDQNPDGTEPLTLLVT
jgi:hypothetical protein